MIAFVKSFASYRTIGKVNIISSALAIDSISGDASTVTISGTAIKRSNIGDWLIVDGMVYRISAVKPQNEQTTITLAFPEDVFSRALELSLQQIPNTTGAFIAAAIHANWIVCDDPSYAIPYLVVSDSDTTKYVPPDVDNSGCFNLADYYRLMRKSFQVTLQFQDAQNQLLCKIIKKYPERHQIVFGDGRSQLQSLDYAVAGTSKITVLHDISTGEKDSDGNNIVTRSRTTWYLAEDGSVSQLIPARRVAGKWETMYISGESNVEDKVIEAFAKNKTDHKLEFWSTLDLSVQDRCTFLVGGELLQSNISYKRKNNSDNRYYYKSGELPTRATEKLKGAAK